MYGILSKLPPDILQHVFNHLDPLEAQYLHFDPFLGPYAIRRMYDHVSVRAYSKSSTYQEMRTDFTQEPQFEAHLLRDFLCAGYIKPERVTLYPGGDILSILGDSIKYVDDIEYDQPVFGDVPQSEVDKDIQTLCSLPSRPKVRLALRDVNLASFPFPPRLIELTVHNSITTDDETDFENLPPTLGSMNVFSPSQELLRNIPDSLNKLVLNMCEVPINLAHVRLETLQIQAIPLQFEEISLPPSLKVLELISCELVSLQTLDRQSIHTIYMEDCTTELTDFTFSPTIENLNLSIIFDSENNTEAQVANDTTTSSICVVGLRLPPKLQKLELVYEDVYYKRSVLEFPASLKELQIKCPDSLAYDDTKNTLDDDKCSIEFPLGLEHLTWTSDSYKHMSWNLAQLNHLKFLSIESPGFDIDVAAFPASLEELILEFCNIEHIDVTHLSRLTHLHLAGNNIAHMEDVKYAPSLAVLCLTSNKITHISQKCTLTELNLDYNSISHISEDFRHSSLIELNIDGNPIQVLDLQSLPPSLRILHAQRLQSITGTPGALSTADFEGCSSSSLRPPYWSEIASVLDPQMRESAFVSKFSNHGSLGMFYDLAGSQKVAVMVGEKIRVYVDDSEACLKKTYTLETRTSATRTSATRTSATSEC